MRDIKHQIYRATAAGSKKKRKRKKVSGQLTRTSKSSASDPPKMSPGHARRKASKRGKRGKKI